MRIQSIACNLWIPECAKTQLELLLWLVTDCAHAVITAKQLREEEGMEGRRFANEKADQAKQ